MKKYKIGDFVFGIQMENDLDVPENFKQFEIDSEEPVQVEYRLNIVDKLPKLRGDCVSKRQDLVVCKEEGLESRRMNFVGMAEAYGVYQEVSENQVFSYLRADFLKMLKADTVFLSLFALEKRMLKHEAMILHCSVLKIKDGVLLFSGPSGIGKSTHADLWVKHRGARVINGDRTLIQKIDGTWMSRGWPICGSSEICHNEEYPIKAVIFMGQASENRGSKLPYFGAVKELISQITANGWDQKFVEKIWTMVEDFAAEIPVYGYSCNMEAAAVDELEKLLSEIWSEKEL